MVGVVIRESFQSNIKTYKISTEVTLTRALRARRARPPEAPEKAPYLAALQPRAQRA